MQRLPCISVLALLSLSMTQDLPAQSSGTAATEDPFTGEEFFERLLQGSDSDHLIETLDDFRRHPLNLRTATRRDLESIPLLAPDLIDAILSLRDRGELTSWTVVESIPAMTPAARFMVRSCAKLEEPSPLRFHASYRGRVQQEDLPRAGFLSGAYPGGRARLLQNVHGELDGHGQVAVLCEKDPGESSAIDHISGHARLQNIGAFTDIIVGDFTVASAQGLLFAQPFALSRGSDVIHGLQRPQTGCRPSASAAEGDLFRGVAMNVHAAPFEGSAFVSSALLDAAIAEDGSVGSVDNSGLHRTATEQSRMGTVNERTVGVRVALNHRYGDAKVRTGTSLLWSRYSRTAASRAPFSFSGTHASGISLDVDVTAPGWSLFSETAVCHTGAVAMTGGGSASLTRGLSTSFLVRHYPPNFVSMHGNAFGERASPSNEQGAYLGIRVNIDRLLSIDAYADVFRFPQRTYLTDLPVTGQEKQVQAQWAAGQHLTLQLRWRSESKYKALTVLSEEGREQHPEIRRHYSGLRVEVQYRPSTSTRIRFRAERCAVSYDLRFRDERGMLFFADLRLRPYPWCTVSARMASYTTESYDSRVYCFENDLRGVMSNVALYGAGLRAYVLLDLTYAAWGRLSMKYGVTLREGVDALGDGADRVDGDRLGSAGVQLELSY